MRIWPNLELHMVQIESKLTEFQQISSLFILLSLWSLCWRDRYYSLCVYLFDAIPAPLFFPARFLTKSCRYSGNSLANSEWNSASDVLLCGQIWNSRVRVGKRPQYVHLDNKKKDRKKYCFNNLESSKLETLSGWDNAINLAGGRKAGHSSPSSPASGVTHFVHVALQLTEPHLARGLPFSLRTAG